MMSSLVDKASSARRLIFWNAPRELFRLHSLIAAKKDELRKCREYEKKLVICAELETLYELKVVVAATTKG